MALVYCPVILAPRASGPLHMLFSLPWHALLYVHQYIPQIQVKLYFFWGAVSDSVSKLKAPSPGILLAPGTELFQQSL